MNFSFVFVGAIALVCGVLFFVGAFRPAYIWPGLIFSLIFGSGLMPCGMTAVDEVWVISLVAGILLMWAKNKNKAASRSISPIRDPLYEIHRWILIVFVLYLLFQCVRGIVVMESIRKVRWVVFFAVLGACSFLLDREKGIAPDRNKVALWVVNSTTVYMAFYLIHGVTAQFFRGTNWWNLQCKEMGTTAYSMFAVALGAPAALILLHERFQSRWWGELCLVAMFLVALYYDSRVAVIVLLSFLALGFFYVPWRPLLRVGAIWILSVGLFGFGFLGKKIDLQTLSTDLLSSGGVDKVVQYVQNRFPKRAPEIQAISVPEDSPAVVPVAVEAVSAPPPAPSPVEPPKPVEKVIPAPPSEPIVIKNEISNERIAEIKTSKVAPVESVPMPRYFLLDSPGGKRPHDIDRIVHAEAVLHLLAKGGFSAIFGYGYRTSGTVISPILRELYSVFIPESAHKIQDDESTEMFTAWVAETGLVGLGLLMGLFIFTAVRLYKNAGGILGLILVTSAGVCFFWTLVINLSDVFLFFFAVLPSGILVALSRPRGSVPTA